MTTPPELAVPHLAWLRTFAASTKSPTPENGDTVFENLTELAMWLGEMQDAMGTSARIVSIRADVASHNEALRLECTRRRAEAVPCGGTTATRCATCTRRQGLSAVTKIV